MKTDPSFGLSVYAFKMPRHYPPVLCGKFDIPGEKELQPLSLTAELSRCTESPVDFSVESVVRLDQRWGHCQRVVVVHQAALRM